MLAGIFLIEFDAAGLDHQVAALRHRIARIHDQIYQHLFDLSWIGLDSIQRRIQFCRQRNVLANQTPQHLVHIGDDVVQIHRQGLQNLLASKGE